MKIFLEPEQIKLFYELAGNRSVRDECLVRIMGNTGFRISDARSLLITQVCSKNGEVYTSIRKRMIKTSNYIERAINDTTRDLIRRHLEMVYGTSIYLFPGPDPSKPVSRWYAHRLFKNLLEKVMPSGTDLKAASTHTLRRSVGFLISEDCSIETAAEFLGHESIASTTYYLSKEALKRKTNEYLQEKMNF